MERWLTLRFLSWGLCGRKNKQRYEMSIQLAFICAEVIMVAEGQIMESQNEKSKYWDCSR